MKILVAYSGGKDSQACLIWASKKYGTGNIEAVFCDTGWEHPITYEHILTTTKALGVKLVTLKSKEYDGMRDLGVKKGRFASGSSRFCTEELKVKPMIDYILSHEEHLLVIQGIRADESRKRSGMEKQCTYFKYYLEPYGMNKKGKPKFHSYRKKDVVEWLKGFNADILRPVFEWTGQQVIDYITNNNQKPNPLYYQGFKRVGCFPCFMVAHPELLEIIERYPERMKEIQDMEEAVGSSFFKPDYIPEKYRTGVSEVNGKVFSRAIDIERYLTDKNATLDLFDQEPMSCSSYYHLCE